MKLIFKNENRSIELPPGCRLVIGRQEDADIRIPDKHVSRRHAEITEEDGKVFVQDLGSHAGTKKNGVGVTDKTELAEGGIRVRCGMVSQYIVNAPTVVKCLEDAYSTQRDLELQHQEVVLPAWLDEQVQQIELGERLTGEGIPVDQIFFPEPCMVTRIPEGAEVRFGGSFQTLCRTEEGELMGRQQKAGQSVNLMTSSDTIPCTWLRGAAGLRRDGGGWAVEQDVELKLGSVCTKPIPMLSGIRAGERRQPDPERPSVIIRARKPDETLWDIAKYCGSTVSAIQRLNKLEREPEENRLLLIPVI